MTMTAKSSTFAGQLKHFAQSIDIVDTNEFDQVRDLVCSYAKRGLKGSYFELLRGEVGDNGDGRITLRTFWSSEERKHVWQIRADDGSYTNPVTAAFDNVVPMWIVSASGRQPLDKADKYLDTWSDAENLPRYRSATGQSIYTLIILPLFFHGRLGIFCMESSQYIGITDVAKWELLRLADALAILFSLWDQKEAHIACKNKAINDLREILVRARFPKLVKPHFFLASSNKADEKVMLIIKSVLNRHSDTLEYTDWTKMSEPGSIMSQISREIMESRFGICYLSEQVDPGPPKRYQDNGNVIFEAGMLHARTSASDIDDGSSPAGWIPIREQNSPPAPFDFAAERILYVPRVDGELNKTELEEMLEARIIALLGVTSEEDG